jgi:hypothetical protein
VQVGAGFGVGAQPDSRSDVYAPSVVNPEPRTSEVAAALNAEEPRRGEAAGLNDQATRVDGLLAPYGRARL